MNANVLLVLVPPDPEAVCRIPVDELLLARAAAANCEPLRARVAELEAALAERDAAAQQREDQLRQVNRLLKARVQTLQAELAQQLRLMGAGLVFFCCCCLLLTVRE